MKNTVFKVLDHGYVKVIDYMGNDEAVVDAAQMSTAKTSRSKEETARSINRMMRDGHTSPFEMCELKLEIKLPIFVARQWWRHRTASINELSMRYTEVEPEYYRHEDWRVGNLPERISHDEEETQRASTVLYKDRISCGIKKEIARKDLPLSIYTTAMWKCDLHNLLNFLRLRMKKAAQPEIRAYAKIIGDEIVSRLWPITYSAWLDYVFYRWSLSGSELAAMQTIVPAFIEDTVKAEEMLKDRLCLGFEDDWKFKDFLYKVLDLVKTDQEIHPLDR